MPTRAAFAPVNSLATWFVPQLPVVGLALVGVLAAFGHWSCYCNHGFCRRHRCRCRRRCFCKIVLTVIFVVVDGAGNAVGGGVCVCVLLVLLCVLILAVLKLWLLMLFTDRRTD